MHPVGAFVRWVVLACTWWCFVRSASLACEDLIRPLDGMEAGLLAGRWALISGGFIDPAKLSYFNRRDSASIDVSVSPGGDISYTPRVHMEGKCHSSTHNVTLEGSALRFRDKSNITVTLVYTSCQDCLLLRFDDDGDNTVMRAYLFSRRREVTEEEKAEFTTQAACLNMLPPVLDIHGYIFPNSPSMLWCTFPKLISPKFEIWTLAEPELP
uniref:Apolipoprotein M n=1 Tax=Hippocampus comes TaxID=109280 RepID=A0A3Q2ZIZ0_HIPCM